MLEECLSCPVVGEREVKLLLGKRLDELLVDLPWSIGAGNNGHTILLFEHFLFVFGQWLPKLCVIGPGCSSSAFLFLFLGFEDVLHLIHIDDGWRECLGDVESHGKHFVQLFLIVDFWLDCHW